MILIGFSFGSMTDIAFFFQRTNYCGDSIEMRFGILIQIYYLPYIKRAFLPEKLQYFFLFCG